MDSFTQKTTLIIFLFLLFHLLATGQPRIFLGEDQAFFQLKAKSYQRWLEKKGMGKVIKVDKVQLKPDQEELELFLSLKTTDPDTAIMIWRGLKEAYREGNRGEEIGHGLFATFVRFMEIPARQGNVQIYFPRDDGFGYNQCFYVWYWEENGEIKEEEKENICKGPVPVSITVLDVNSTRTEAQFVGQRSASSSLIFGKILEYARNRYEVRRCENRFPKVEVLEQTPFLLRFAVSDLCREVLTQERRGVWCSVLQQIGIPCNSARRERLEFSFTFSAADRGYVLNGSITGKYGSGIYQPRKSGYIDMEPDFEDDFLIPYVRGFQADLQNVLQRP